MSCCPRDGDSAWLSVQDVSVKMTKGGVPGFLGLHDVPGAICLPLEAIRKVLLHFGNTDFVLVGDHIGRELRGVPMGTQSAILP